MENLKGKTILQLAAMSVVVAGFAALMALVGKLAGTVEMGIETATSMTILLIGMATACRVAAVAGQAGRAGFVGVGLLLTFIAGLALVMIGLGALARSNPDVEKDLNFAIMIFDKIGNALGAGIGGLVNGILQSIDFDIFTRFGEDLNGCIEALKPALAAVDGIDISAFDKLSKLGSALLSLTAAELLDGIKKWLTGGSSLSDFGSQLASVGSGLMLFSIYAKAIQSGEHIDYAIELIRRLAEVGKEIPNSGGLLGMIMGNNDMDKFGSQLKDLATGLVDFCDEVQGIKYNIDVDNAILTVKKLASAAKEIPNTGGLLGDLIGNNDMDNFASQMPAVASGVTKFCEGIQGLKYSDDVSNAADVMSKLATASQNIPNIGGKLAALIGDNRMDVFANQMPIAGEGIKGFCDNIDGIQTGNVDDSISVMVKLIEASKQIKNTGGFFNLASSDQELRDWAAQITWMGQYLWIYSTWIDKIKDFGVLEESIGILTSFAGIAEAIAGIDYKRFNQFESEMVDFAQTGLTAFVDVFDKVDTKSIGKKLSEDITTTLHATRSNFVKEGQWLIEGFLSGVKFKMNGFGGVKDVGKEVGQTFLEGMTDGLDVNSPSGETEWIGDMTILGFLNGLTGNEREVYKAGIAIGENFMRGAQERLDIHSPSGEGGWLGEMTIDGIINGFTSGFDSLLGQFDGLWGKMQSLSQTGINGIKDIIGDRSLWDFSASVGDNLVTMRDNLKEWLGFGDSGGLSDLFGFGSLSEALEEEILDSYSGIQDGMAGLADEISKKGGGSASDLAEALKLSLHKHFDSKEFIYLGEQIGEDMAIAATNCNNFG